MNLAHVLASAVGALLNVCDLNEMADFSYHAADGATIGQFHALPQSSQT